MKERWFGRRTGEIKIVHGFGPGVCHDKEGMIENGQDLDIGEQGTLGVLMPVTDNPHIKVVIGIEN